MKRQAQIAFFGFISTLISTETGINYLDLEPGNEFWNQVWVPSTCYKSLTDSKSVQAYTHSISQLPLSSEHHAMQLSGGCPQHWPAAGHQ